VSVDDERAVLVEDDDQDEERLYADLKEYLRAVRMDLEGAWSALAKFFGGTGAEREMELYQLEQAWLRRRAARRSK